VPLFGVLVALGVDGTVIVGVCHFPALGETVTAARSGLHVERHVGARVAD
jgi:fructose-1,6-bisphosphatase/inositol monophosphatase family enzyme